MRLYIKRLGWCIFSVMMISTVNAGSLEQREQVQVPQCLAQKIQTPHQIISENQQFKIIEMASSDLEKLTLLADKVRCGKYINVSHQFNKGLTNKKQVATSLLNKPAILPLRTIQTNYEISHQEAVNKALQTIESDNIWQTLTHLTSYYNRSATTDTGVETAKWLKSQFENMAVEYGRTDTKTYLVDTSWYYIQPSLVTVIGKDIDAPAVVIGAHIDTLSGKKPGAGDDGSGTSSTLEAARALLASNVELKHPVYFIWYAAEERGLVGSQKVVEDFIEKAIPVKAVIQFDMTGFRNDQTDPTMWVFTDYTNKALTKFTEELITTYVKVPVNYSKCGYGCSDHASWTSEGYAAAFPCETNFEDHNPYIHTASDTMDLMNLDHMTNFSKLALAFALELAL